MCSRMNRLAELDGDSRQEVLMFFFDNLDAFLRADNPVLSPFISEQHRLIQGEVARVRAMTRASPPL